MIQSFHMEEMYRIRRFTGSLDQKFRITHCVEDIVMVPAIIVDEFVGVPAQLLRSRMPNQSLVYPFCLTVRNRDKFLERKVAPLRIGFHDCSRIVKPEMRESLPPLIRVF